MDVVKRSAIAACAVLALMSAARQGQAAAPAWPSPVSRQSLEAGPRQWVSSKPTISVSPVSPPGPAAERTSAPLTTIGVSRRYPVRPSAASASSFDALIEEAAHRFAVPPSWLREVMRIESGGRTLLSGQPITSPAGAMGLMQVMPRTFTAMTQRYGLGRDPYDPRANIYAGAAFLREMYDRYGPEHFLDAYNAGPGRVDDHLRSGRPLPLETQRYTQFLAPRLLSGGHAGSPGAPLLVQDLTSAEAMRSVALPLHLSHSPTPSDPETAPLFVTESGGPSTGVRQPDGSPNDGLFVRLTRRDQRAGEPGNDSGGN